MLSKITDVAESWDLHLSKVEFFLNNTLSRSIQNTPSRLLFGVDQKGELSDKLKDFVTINSEQRGLEQIASESIRKVQEYNKSYYDKSHKKPHVYQVGDVSCVSGL